MDRLHRRKPPASSTLLARSVLAGALAFSLDAPVVAQSTAAATREYAIPAGPLDEALNRYGREAGIVLSFTPQTTAGLRSRGLHGSHAVPEGLAELLAGTGLQAVAQNGGGYTLARQPGPGESGGELPSVKVRDTTDAETPTGPVAGYVARRSATATKNDTPIVETPQSISVIGREEMDARGVQDVMEAIRYTPGVAVNMYGPDNRGWEDITLRGFSTYYNNYRDGLIQTPAGVTYPIGEPYGLERVEVLRGPSSVVLGQGDAGGVVNRISKRPAADAVREIELQVGSFDRRQLAIDYGDSFGDSDTLRYRVVGVGLNSNDQDEYPDGSKLNRKRTYLAPSLAWQPTAATSLTLLGEYLKNESAEDPYYLAAPGLYTHVKMGDPDFSGIEQEQSALGYELQHAFDDAWSLHQNFRYSRFALHRRVVWGDGLEPDGHTFARIARTWDDPMNQAALDTQIHGRLRAGRTEHELLFGVDWNEQRATALRFIGPAPSIDILDPHYLPITTPRDPLADYSQTIRQSGLYAQDQIRLGDRWIVTLGGRRDSVRSTTDDRLEATHTRQSDDEFSGRAGLTWLAGGGWAPYLSYAESFLPNSGLDADARPFDPSRGKQVELGAKFQPEGSAMLFTAAVFDLRKTNVVTYDPVTFEGRQIGEQRSRGVELEVKTEIARGLNLTASYTWLDLEVLRSADPSEVGKVPPVVPDRSASLWLDYATGDGFGVGGGVRHVGRAWNDNANTSSVAGFTVFDATAHYERGPWRYALNVSNLFDRDYFTICYYGECYRGAERAAMLSAKYRF